MTSPKIDFTKAAQAATALAAISMSTMLIAGCAEEPPPPPPPKKAPPPPPPPPDPMENVTLHEKVTFPAELEPPSPEVAMAIAALANAFAAGDDEALRGAIVDSDHSILDALIAAGMWGDNTESIEAVRVCALDDNGESTNVGIGIQDNRGAYLLAWETGSDKGFKWQSMDIELQTATRVSELDGASLLPRHVGEAKKFLVVLEEEDAKRNSGADSGGSTTSPGNAPSGPGGRKPKRKIR